MEAVDSGDDGLVDNNEYGLLSDGLSWEERKERTCVFTPSLCEAFILDPRGGGLL